MVHSSKEPQRGFSLVEVVIATLLLAIITAGIFSVTLSSQKIIARSHLRHSAYEVSQTVFERLRAYLDSTSWNDTSSPLYPNGTWQTYYLNSPDPLGIYNFFNNSEMASKYNCLWSYIVTNGIGCGGSSCDYRNVTVRVNCSDIVL